MSAFRQPGSFDSGSLLRRALTASQRITAVRSTSPSLRMTELFLRDGTFAEVSSGMDEPHLFISTEEKSVSCFRLVSALGLGVIMVLRTRFNTHALA
jgi:hypothetical protein